MNEIHRDQYKNVKIGEEFWLIRKDGSLRTVSFKDSSSYWAFSPRGMGIGTVVKTPKGEFLATIQVCNKWKRRFVMKWGKTSEEAAARAFEENEQERTFAEAMEDPAKELEYREGIYARDPHFAMSDDHSVWASGQFNLSRIKELKKQLDIRDQP